MICPSNCVQYTVTDTVSVSTDNVYMSDCWIRPTTSSYLTRWQHYIFISAEGGIGHVYAGKLQGPRGPWGVPTLVYTYMHTDQDLHLLTTLETDTWICLSFVHIKVSA